MLNKLTAFWRRYRQHKMDQQIDELRLRYAQLNDQILTVERAIEEADKELTRLSAEKAQLEGRCHLRRVK